INILGTLDAPGGSITLDAGFLADTRTIPSSQIAFNTIYLGPQGSLSAKGASQVQVDTFGHRIGSVLSGGSVTIENTLYFIARTGSTIDVSGAETMLDFATGRQIGIRPQFAPSLVASNAGSISLSAIDGLFLGSKLLGRPGDFGNPAGPVATGGSLVVQAIG